MIYQYFHEEEAEKRQQQKKLIINYVISLIDCAMFGIMWIERTGSQTLQPTKIS